MLECLLELATTASPGDVRLVLAGLPVLADHLPPGANHLTEGDLAFTLAECQDLGLDHRPHDGWPAPVTLSLRGAALPGAYAAQLLHGLQEQDQNLLSAALLNEWTTHTPAAQLRALDLPTDYARRLRRHGWPVLDVHQGEGDTLRIPHVLRDAMLNELRQLGRLSEYQARLADAVQENEPIRALELRTASHDHVGALRLIRDQLPDWLAERNWSVINDHLTGAFSRLLPTERLILAQARAELASTHADLSTALKFAMAAREAGVNTLDSHLLIARILERLGRLEPAMRHVQTALSALPPHTPAALNAAGQLALCHVDLGNSALAIIELEQAGMHRADPDHSPLVYVAAAAAHLAQGDIPSAQAAATQAYLAYVNNPAHLHADPRTGLRLLRLLTDLDQPTRAQHLDSLLPTHLPPGRWYTIAHQLWRAYATWRGHQDGNPQAELANVLAAASEAALHDLEQQGHVTACLMALHRHDYVTARAHLHQLARTSHSDAHLQPLISDLRFVLQACSQPHPGPRPTTMSVYPRETHLVLARASRHPVTPGPYAPAVWNTWYAWSPHVPDTAPVALPTPSNPLEYPTEAVPRTTKLEIRVLGQATVTLQDYPLKVSPRELAILLVLADRQPHAMSELAGALFADSQNPKSYASVTMTKLRQAVGRILPVDDVIQQVPGGYALAKHLHVTCDLHQIDSVPLTALPDLYRGPLALNAPWMYLTPDSVRVRVMARLAGQAEGDAVRARLRQADPALR